MRMERELARAVALDGWTCLGAREMRWSRANGFSVLNIAEFKSEFQ